MFEHQTISSFFRGVHAERLARQPRLSLRSLAKSLDLSPAYLSQVINGKRRMSAEKAMGVATLLHLPAPAAEYLTLLADLECATSDELRKSVRARLARLARRSHDQMLDSACFALIKDWYHIPIMEMTFLDGPPLASAEIARRLGIAKVEAEVAIERLLRLSLVAREPDGRLVKTAGRVAFRARQRHQAFADFHRQMIGLAAEAIDSQTLAERVITSQTFCIDRELVSEARDLTREFISRMADLYAKSAACTDVYQLNVQFFNLTDGRQKRRVQAKGAGR